MVPIWIEEQTPFGGTAESHVYTSLGRDSAWTMHIVGTSSALAVHKKIMFCAEALVFLALSMHKIKFYQKATPSFIRLTNKFLYQEKHAVL